MGGKRIAERAFVHGAAQGIGICWDAAMGNVGRSPASTASARSDKSMAIRRNHDAQFAVIASFGASRRGEGQFPATQPASSARSPSRKASAGTGMPIRAKTKRTSTCFTRRRMRPG